LAELEVVAEFAGEGGGGVDLIPVEVVADAVGGELHEGALTGEVAEDGGALACELGGFFFFGIGWVGDELAEDGAVGGDEGFVVREGAVGEDAELVDGGLGDAKAELRVKFEEVEIVVWLVVEEAVLGVRVGDVEQSVEAVLGVDHVEGVGDGGFGEFCELELPPFDERFLGEVEGGEVFAEEDDLFSAVGGEFFDEGFKRWAPAGLVEEGLDKGAGGDTEGGTVASVFGFEGGFVEEFIHGDEAAAFEKCGVEGLVGAVVFPSDGFGESLAEPRGDAEGFGNEIGGGVVEGAFDEEELEESVEGAGDVDAFTEVEVELETMACSGHEELTTDGCGWGGVASFPKEFDDDGALGAAFAEEFFEFLVQFTAQLE